MFIHPHPTPANTLLGGGCMKEGDVNSPAAREFAIYITPALLAYTISPWSLVCVCVKCTL